MKQLLSIIMALIACCPIYSQVTVGAGTEPQKFSVLEIISNSKGGLRLPQLTADERQTLEDSDEFQAEKESKAKGLMIYNLDTDCVDTWAGNQWISKCTSVAPTISISSNPANGVVILNREVTMTATVTGTEPLTYQWLKDGQIIAGATSATYTVNNMSHDDRGSYTCTVSNEAGNAVSNTLPITYICGAMTTSGTFLQFMCHNLGADESLDPLTHNERLYGDYYQWGTNTPGWVANGGSTNNTAWGDGTTNDNPTKGSNDPCPSGWKIPSKEQWQSIYKTSGNGPLEDATANTWRRTFNGFMVGDALYLPAAGCRAWAGGLLNGEDQTSIFWCTTLSTPPTAGSLYPISLEVRDNPASININFSNRAYGLSVRCVKE